MFIQFFAQQGVQYNNEILGCFTLGWAVRVATMQQTEWQKKVHSLAGFCVAAVPKPGTMFIGYPDMCSNIHCCSMLVSNIMICHMMMLIIGKIFMDLYYDT